MITTIDEVYALHITGSHYRPEKYLKNYLFSKEILLDVFCSEDMVFCFEDYYYDDINLDMIQKYQPHINIPEFTILWNDLDEIRIAELFSNFIIQNPKKYTYKYNIIEKYLNKYQDSNFDINILLNDYKNMLLKNKFIKKYNLFNENEINNIINIDDASKIARIILENIPSIYTSILPL
jgi:hypothetical protein